MTGPESARTLRTTLMAVIAVGLLLLGGGLAVALGIGRTEAPSADSVDAGFARDMALHHLQGVEMADMAVDRSEDRLVRGLAHDISSTQNNQAGRMQGWLVLWDVPLTGGERMAWMADGDHGGHAMTMDDGLMPGMATEEELANLAALSGTEFDVEFLRLMIRHHQGGTGMADAAAEEGKVAAVRSLAGTISETQAVETTVMTDMLTARGGTPLPTP